MKKLKGVISAAVLSLYLLTPAHADGGFQGAIKGGIPESVLSNTLKSELPASGRSFPYSFNTLKIKEKNELAL